MLLLLVFLVVIVVVVIVAFLLLLVALNRGVSSLALNFVPAAAAVAVAAVFAWASEFCLA